MTDSARDIAKLVIALPAEKRKLVEDRVRKLIGRPQEYAAPAAGNDYVASFPQQELWLAHQLAADPCSYNIIWRATMAGVTDVEALQRAVEKVTQRHEVLRTCYYTENAQIRARVLSIGEVDFSVQDCRRMRKEERTEAEQEWYMALVATPFQLDADAPYRVGVCRHPDDVVRLYLFIHHIAFDAWSAGLLFEELAVAYADDSALPVMETQYGDFAVWQRQRNNDPDMAESAAYWKKTLDPYPPAVTIPEDWERPARRSGRGSRVAFSVETGTIERLKQKGRALNATLFSVMLSAFKILLLKYNGIDDIAVGTLAANRSQRRFEHVVGCFANTIILRTVVSESRTLNEVTRVVNEVVRSGIDHQEMPFQKVISDVAPPRVPGKAPLAQVMFVLQDVPSLSRVDGFKRIERLDNGFAFYDLTMTLGAEPERAGYTGWVEYDTDLYKVETIQKVVDYYGLILRYMEDTGDTVVGDLPPPTLR